MEFTNSSLIQIHQIELLVMLSYIKKTSFSLTYLNFLTQLISVRF